MRLLDTTSFELKTFIGGHIPPYAILSHTWCADEFLFEDLKAGKIHDQLANPGRGLQKVLATCELARKKSLKYAWIDTCCIDKSSSAELSEAINSMYAWYRDSADCYAWLEDVTIGDGMLTDFRRSKWFFRGWCLQELLAPHGLTFFDRNWYQLHSRYEMAQDISEITGIKPSFLRRQHDGPLRRFFHGSSFTCRTCGGPEDFVTEIQREPVASVMNWASQRQTTRVEDMAYCLLGLFGVNMPLLYGEGPKAFRRLQMEILASAPDQSILNWREDKQYMRYQDEPPDERRPFLAPSPSCFRAEALSRLGPANRNDLHLTPDGLVASVWLTSGILYQPNPYRKEDVPFYLAALTCPVESDVSSRVGILVTVDNKDLLKNTISPHTVKCVRMFPNTQILIRHNSAPQVLSSEQTSSGPFSRSEVQGALPTVTANVDLGGFKPYEILLVERPLRLSSQEMLTKPQLRLDTTKLHDYSVAAACPSPGSDGILSLGGIDYPHRRPSDINEKGLLGPMESYHNGVLFLLRDPTSGFFVFWRSRQFAGPRDLTRQVQYSVQTWESIMGTRHCTAEVAKSLSGAAQIEEMSRGGVSYQHHDDLLAALSRKSIPDDQWFETPCPGPVWARIRQVRFLGHLSYVLEIESRHESQPPTWAQPDDDSEDDIGRIL